MPAEVTGLDSVDLEIPATIQPEMTDRGRYPRSEDDDSGPIPRGHRHSRANDEELPWYSLMRVKLGDLVTIVTLVIAIASMRFEINALKEQVIELRADVKEALATKAEIRLLAAQVASNINRMDKMESLRDRDIEDAKRVPHP